MEKLTIPNWVQSKYYPIYPENAETNPSHNRIVTTHITTEGIPYSTMFEKGFSHVAMLTSSSDASLPPKDKRCFTPLAYFQINGNPTRDVTEASARDYANSFGASITKKFVFIDEFKDGSWAINGDYHRVGNWFYNQLCITTGSTGQSDNNFFGIYMDPESNLIGNSFNPPGSGRNPTAPYYKNKLASQTEARKDSAGNVHGYFSSGMSQWSNQVISAYYSVEIVNNDWLFHKIAEGQVKYAAMPSIKTIIYAWTGTQSVVTDVDNWSGSDGWKHQRTGGYWRAKEFMINTPYNILCAAFFGCAFFEGYYGWDATLTLSRDESRLRANYSADRTNWVSEGSPAPVLPPFNAPGNAYPNLPRMGEDMVVVAANLWNKIRPYYEASDGWRYAPYTANGTSIEVRPGDSRLFRRNFTNYGQDTILYLAQQKVGGCFYCQGLGKTIIVFTNPYLSSIYKQTIVATCNGTVIGLGDLAGSSLHVFIHDGTTVVPCTDEFTQAQQDTLNNWAGNNQGTYLNNLTANIYRKSQLWTTSLGSYNPDKILPVASLGKQFAATVLMKLVSDGLFANGVNTTVGSLIPSFTGTKASITLKQLMSHTSGMMANSLPVGSEGPYEDNRNITTQEAADGIAATVPLLHTPGTHYEYGGVHWCIAARMAEVVTGKTWMQICQERIFGPLGMTSTDYSLGLGDTPSNPTIHAGLRTTLNDWTKLMIMRLNKGVYNGVRIMSEASVLAMETNQTGLSTQYGFGLYLDTVNNETFHEGATGCITVMNRNKNYVATLLTTVYNGGASGKNGEFRGLVRTTVGAAPIC